LFTGPGSFSVRPTFFGGYVWGGPGKKLIALRAIIKLPSLQAGCFAKMIRQLADHF